MNNIKEKLLNTNSFIDNEYLDLYINIICNNSTSYKKYKTSKHHIIPVSYYKNNNLEVDNSTDNTVILLHKYHILAHYYLTLCTTGNLNKSMIFAFNFMIDEKNKYKHLGDITDIDLDTLANLREKRSILCSEKQKGMKASQETIEKMKKSFFKTTGVNSPAKMPGVNLKISKSKKGICTMTEQQKQKLKESVIKAHIGIHESESWRKNISNTLKGHSVSIETRQKISEKCKGHIPPNKNAIAVNNYHTTYISVNNFNTLIDLYNYLNKNKLDIGTYIKNQNYKNITFIEKYNKQQLKINYINNKILANSRREEERD